jgi:hypothetical protein
MQIKKWLSPLALGGMLRSFSNFLQERFRREKKRRSEGLGEKHPNPGCFWFTAVGGRFFGRRKDFRVASLGSGLRMAKKTAHMKLILCVSSKLFYSSGMQRLQCNIGTQISSNQHVLALGLCD